MGHQNFVLFSNTIEEYEAFINKGVFYWPNEITKLTQSQRKLDNLELPEKVGDKIAIVVGAKMKNIKDSYLREKITHSPMMTHIAEVSEVYERPVLGYRYTHGKNPSSSFMLPFEFLPQFKELPNYLGTKFTDNNLLEIDKAIEFGDCIRTLMDSNELKFTRAFFKDDSIYIQSENDEEVYELALGFPRHRKADKSITSALTYRELPDIHSLQKIVQTCNDLGLDGENLILRLRTWRGSKFMKMKILEEKFQSLNGKLQEGISTRLLTANDESDPLLNEIQKYLNDNNDFKNEVEKMSFPKNTILYGPPGTGKTYKVIEKAVNIVNPYFSDVERTRKDYEEAYHMYIENKQIQFCTFHQSFSYEDFVEGLRSDIEKEGAPFTPQNGVFKEICELAKSRYQLSNSSSTDIDQSDIYKISLGKANSIEGEKIYRYCIENKLIALGHGSGIDFTNKNNLTDVSNEFGEYEDDTSNSVIKMVNNFKNILQIGDIVIVSKGNLKLRAIAKVTGHYYYDEETEIPYNHFRKVEWLFISSNEEEAEHIFNATNTDSRRFSQQSIYPFGKDQLNIEAIKNFITPNKNAEEERFVLIIDEINRGNISKIFGELITLIEEDKRFNVEDDGTIKGLEVTLPYSNEKFSVPKNVYILGTMNTADRSISLMDTALRRRFDFEEMLPEPDVLTEVEGIDVQSLLKKINQRIEYLYDRDHQVGHAFFIGKESSSELIEVMQRKIIPLLQEYFYDDWEKIELVLGGAINSDSNENDYFLSKKTINANELFGKTAKIQSKKVVYSLVKDPSAQALINIYIKESVAIDE
ncbi:AAA family ATPase [Exiguobacterium antarcticum]|uniref:AAA family ATPase n=1 Tax=Exiguobacterium antarcticum TaxID=132920 RepID=UPI00054D7ADC|nr:AAA family ATPase [Exiguobacterium antarcticum]